jgi:hypothetical protein
MVAARFRGTALWDAGRDAFVTNLFASRPLVFSQSRSGACPASCSSGLWKEIVKSTDAAIWATAAPRLEAGESVSRNMSGLAAKLFVCELVFDTGAELRTRLERINTTISLCYDPAA